MRMFLGVFAFLTVIEIFADAALVANSNNWSNATTVALNALVYLIWVHRLIEWVCNRLLRGSSFRGAIDLVRLLIWPHDSV